MEAKIPFPPNVHIFPTESVERVPLVVDGEEVAAIYGQSYAKSEQRENLAWKFNRAAGDRFSIGMLHTQIGSRESTYAPCTLEDLKECGMDYWALGHIHKHESFVKSHISSMPATAGLDCTETGPRGCYYVEVGPYGRRTWNLSIRASSAGESIDLAIDGIESVSELRESVRFAKEKVRRNIGKPTFLTVNFTGSGSMYHVLNNPEATQYWLDSWREEEQGKYAFVMVERCATWPGLR